MAFCEVAGDIAEDLLVLFLVVDKGLEAFSIVREAKQGKELVSGQSRPPGSQGNEGFG